MKVVLPDFGDQDQISLSEINLNEGLMIGYVNGNPVGFVTVDEGYSPPEHAFFTIGNIEYGGELGGDVILGDLVKRILAKNPNVTFEYFKTR